MKNLTTDYLGMNLKNPILASASPLSRTLDGIRRLEDGGVSAIVLYSLFEEQITHESLVLDHYLDYGTESFGEATTYLPDAPGYNIGSEEYLDLIRDAKQAVSIPIIASLNGVTRGGWIKYARQIELAGADALELNLYYIPNSVDVSGADIEELYVDVLRDVQGTVSIPVAVKLSPYFSSTAYMARRLVETGARSLVLFNRFYQPDFDLEKLEVVPSLELSRSYDLRLPLHWAAILYGQIDADIAITGGVHTFEDVLKAMMAGANVVQMASELLKHGPGRVKEILEEVSHWMTEFEYESIQQMRGSLSHKHSGNTVAYDRNNYMRVLHTFRPETSGWSG